MKSLLHTCSYYNNDKYVVIFLILFNVSERVNG